MNEWTLSAEFIAMIINLILIQSYYERRWSISPRSRLCLAALWLTLASILLDVLCVAVLSHTAVPTWVNLGLNTLYFFLITGVSTLLSFYITNLILERVYDSRCILRYLSLLSIPLAIYALFLIWNLGSGLIFYFDASGSYCRGPWINVGYLVVLADLSILGICAWRHRRAVSPPIQQVMKILPVAAVLLILFQVLYPDVLLNGSIAVSANLILFINLQSRRVEIDALTCIGNRSSFFHTLVFTIQKQTPYQLIAVSIKNFSVVNKRFGYQSGDAFLCEIARWLDTIHPYGRAFRTANMEFVLLLPYQGQDKCESFLHMLESRFHKEWVLDQRRATFEARFSQLICQGEAWTSEEVLEFLEAGMDMTTSTTPVVRVDGLTRVRLKEQKAILQLVRESIEEHRFQTWYQPIFHCATGSFDSAEALLRLQDRNGSPVSPTRFVSLAEQNGLIDDLSWIVLEDTCRLLGSAEGKKLRAISINLSMQQFVSDDLIQRIVDCLVKNHASADQLRIEITERMLAQDPERMRHIMTRLSSLGIRFYLDDFGTGYSNLSGILSLPISCVKLDHGMLYGFPEDQRSRTMIVTLTELFHNMGCQVVAEGIETKQQAAALQEIGVDQIQGFYYALPMSQSKLCSFLNYPPHRD